MVFMAINTNSRDKLEKYFKYISRRCPTSILRYCKNANLNYKVLLFLQTGKNERSLIRHCVGEVGKQVLSLPVG